MSRIVILSGGISDERPVSLRSGAAVTESLEAAGHEVTLLDTDEDFDKHLAAMKAADVVFPVLHGLGGEDGVPQSYLELHGITYVGSDAASSRLCIDKWQTKELLQEHGLPTPPAVLVNLDTIWSSELISKPFVLKPDNGGSSVDTIIMRDMANLDKAKVESLTARHLQMLLESLVVGTEITVGVVGEVALPVVEIHPPAHEEFDYENKYNGETREICPPETISEEVQKQAQELALQVHQLCGCRDYSRTDMIVDADGGLHILEINTIPGLTHESLLPKAAKQAGLSMPELCNRLVTFALDRQH